MVTSMNTYPDKISFIKDHLSILDVCRKIGRMPGKDNKINSIYNSGDETPSMHIYPDTDRFTDYSTGKKGDLIDLYRDFYNIDDAAAIKELYELAGGKDNFNRPPKSDTIKKNKTITLIEEAPYFGQIKTFEADPEDEFTKSILELRTELQKQMYTVLYEQCGCDQRALDYLQGEKRNLAYANIMTHKLFTIKEDTEKFLLAEFEIARLIDAGLFTEKGYFIFRNHRLLIPYLQNDEIVYLRGRYLDVEGNTEPTGKFSKYISLYNKYAHNLTLKRWFNLDCLSLPEIDKEKDAYIFEGEFDAMIGQQMGNYSIGFPGVGNFPYDEIDFLRDWNIYLCTDNDAAGDKAALDIATAIKRKLNKPVKRIKLKGKDISESFKGLQ